jgi:hypothetical protein
MGITKFVMDQPLFSRLLKEGTNRCQFCDEPITAGQEVVVNSNGRVIHRYHVACWDNR